MIRVSCNARLRFRVLLDCKEEDEAIAIVKRHMHGAALQAALEMKRDGIDTDLEVEYLVAYEEAPTAESTAELGETGGNVGGCQSATL